MKLIELEQGTQDWLDFRLAHYPASEAPAMLGLSPYKKREDLLREKKTGITPEVDAATQWRFDQGHRTEALARPFVEQILGAELFPCVGVLEGTKLSASFDGLTLDQSTVFECKSINRALRDCASAADLPEHYKVQLEQQLLVSGAEKAVLGAYRFDESDEPLERIEYEYRSDTALRQRILDGWKQFEKDLAAYEVKPEAAPVVGRIQDSLPVLHLKAEGQLLASNLDAFKEAALSTLASINTELETDQDFADAEVAVKFCKTLEARLIKAQESLHRGAGIHEAIEALALLAEHSKSRRLGLEKVIKAKKESIKCALIEAAYQRVIAHVSALNEARSRALDINDQSLRSELAATIKGLKSLASMQNALDRVVLQRISAINEKARQAEGSEGNPQPAAEHAALFDLSIEEINAVLWPIFISADASNIEGLPQALHANDWTAAKRCLIAHIERAEFE